MGFVTQWGSRFKSVVIQCAQAGQKKIVIHNFLEVQLQGQESQYT